MHELNELHHNINRVTQRSEEEDRRIQRIGDLITFCVVASLLGLAAKLCWG